MLPIAPAPLADLASRLAGWPDPDRARFDLNAESTANLVPVPTLHDTRIKRLANTDPGPAFEVMVGPYRMATLARHDAARIAPNIARIVEHTLWRLGVPLRIASRQRILLMPDWAFGEWARENGVPPSHPPVIRSADGRILCDMDRLGRESQHLGRAARQALQSAVICNVAQHSRKIGALLPSSVPIEGAPTGETAVREAFAHCLFRALEPHAVATPGEGTSDARVQALFERLCQALYVANAETAPPASPAALKRHEAAGQVRGATPLLALAVAGPDTATNAHFRAEQFGFRAQAFAIAAHAERMQQRVGTHTPPGFHLGDRIAALVFAEQDMHVPSVHSSACKRGHDQAAPAVLVVNRARVAHFAGEGRAGTLRIEAESLLAMAELALNPETFFALRDKVAQQPPEKLEFGSCDLAFRDHFEYLDLMMPVHLASELLGRPESDLITNSRAHRAGEMFRANNRNDTLVKLLVAGHAAPEAIDQAHAALLETCEKTFTSFELHTHNRTHIRAEFERQKAAYRRAHPQSV